MQKYKWAHNFCVSLSGAKKQIIYRLSTCCLSSIFKFHNFPYIFKTISNTSVLHTLESRGVRKEESRVRKAAWVRWDLTISSAQTDTSQENITGKRLLVPHSQFQADIPYVPWIQATEGKGVVPLGVHTLFHYVSFVFCSFAVVREQVSGRYRKGRWIWKWFVT